MIGRVALVAGFAAALVLPSLGQRVITSGDEARFAILAQDMLVRGTWFDARVREERYRNKPLLYPWAIKLASMPRGRVTETTAHLPIAAAAIAVVLFTTVLGEQLFSPTAGVAAGAVTATSYAFFAHSQTLLPDMLVVAFGVGALCAFRAAVQNAAHRSALVAFYVAVALGVAAKGPMGLLPLLVAGVWLLAEHGVRGLSRLGTWLGALAFVAVTVAWLLPYLVAGSSSFARGVVWGDWLAWYLGFPRPLAMLNRGLDGARGFLPWTPVLILPLLAVRRQWRSGPFRLAFLALVVPLITVSLSLHFRERYLLPIYPAAALLVGWWCERPGARRPRPVAAVVWLTALTTLVAIEVGAWLRLDPTERALIVGFGWMAAAVVLGTAAITGYACWMLLAGRPRALVAGVALAAAVLFVAGAQIYDRWEARNADFPGLAALVERYAEGGDVAVIGGRFFSIDFYLGRGLRSLRTAPELDSWLARPARPLVVITERAWSILQGQILSDVAVVDAMRVHGQRMLLLRRSAS